MQSILPHQLQHHRTEHGRTIRLLNPFVQLKGYKLISLLGAPTGQQMVLMNAGRCTSTLTTSSLRDYSMICHCNRDGHGHIIVDGNKLSEAGKPTVAHVGGQAVISLVFGYFVCKMGLLQIIMGSFSSPWRHDRVNLRPDIVPSLLPAINVSDASVEGDWVTVLPPSFNLMLFNTSAEASEMNRFST